MPHCPQCNREYIELPRKCTACLAELDLLVDYVSHLQSGLEQAERLTRTGELGPAVWAYLSVLEVDPDNPVARRQVGQVATAVRTFDRTAPGRRWIGRLRGEINGDAAGSWLRWLKMVLVVVLIAAAFALGYLCGSGTWPGGNGDIEETPQIETAPPDHGLMGG